MFTKELIEQLISCAKNITEAPKTIKGKTAFSKRTFAMQSVDGKYEFGAYMEQNATFQENFSIGLVYYPKEEKGRICLLRCNGPHGGVKNIPHHSFCHIHTVDPNDANDGIKVERHIIETTEYATYDDAIQYFIKHINITPADRKKHFPTPDNRIEINFGEDL